VDEVVGVLRKADLVAVLEPGKVPDFENILRKPLVVHENLSVLRALEMFKKSPVHMAVIMDEYGSIEGIVTLSDIVEVIAGNIPDHEDDIVPEIHKRGANIFIMDGMVSVYDLRQKLECDELPEGDFSTLAGFLLYELGHLPQTGEKLVWGDWEFTVLAMDKNRVAKVHVRRLNDDNLDDEMTATGTA